MIHLIGNLYSVEVPSDATEIKISGINWLCCLIKNKWWAELELIGNFKILGEVTKDEITFDVEPYVDENEFDIETYDGILVGVTKFWDYENDGFYFYDKNESFRSLLHSKGIDLNKENVKLIILEKL